MDLQDEVEVELAKYEGLLPSSVSTDAPCAGDGHTESGHSATKNNTQGVRGVPHGQGEDRYKHMSSLSMGDICARVVIHARVPSGGDQS